MYLDTSVAVKLFIPEPDSTECELIVGGAGFISSDLLYGEMQAAALGKARGGHLDVHSAERAFERFEAALAEGNIHLIKLDGLLVREAAEVMRQVYPLALRPLDAIHLATYLSVDAGPLFTRDRRMREAAAKLGIPLAG